MKKTLSGVLLIILGFGLIVSLAFPALSDSENAGRTQKTIFLNLPFLENEKSELVLIYFGYVGCTSVCTPALQDLSGIYKELQSHRFKKIPSVWFINMTPEMGASEVQSWAEHFHKGFKSYAPRETELQNMVQALNVVYTQLGMKADHTPYLYLLRKEKKGYELSFIYTSSPYNRRLILKDVGALQ